MDDQSSVNRFTTFPSEANEYCYEEPKNLYDEIFRNELEVLRTKSWFAGPISFHDAGKLKVHQLQYYDFFQFCG